MSNKYEPIYLLLNYLKIQYKLIFVFYPLSVWFSTENHIEQKYTIIITKCMTLCKNNILTMSIGHSEICNIM